MSREITVKGVVVFKRPVGEGSVRISLYTDALGLVSAAAKSAREERSKLRAHLQEGTYGTYTLVQGALTWRLTGALNTKNIFFDADRSARRESAARVFSIVRQFVRGEGSDPYLFNVVWEYLRIVPALENEELQEAECVAVLRIMAALGYVEAANGNEKFLNAEYGTELLAQVKQSRVSLVRAINEGIAVSGL